MLEFPTWNSELDKRSKQQQKNDKFPVVLKALKAEAGDFRVPSYFEKALVSAEEESNRGSASHGPCSPLPFYQ
jgi:hypothetical protein